MAVIFVTKIENGEKVSEGICMKCAKEMGLPVDNMLGNVLDKFGMSGDQLEAMEEEINGMLGDDSLPSDDDDTEDGGAPAIDFPKLIRESGLFQAFNSGPDKKEEKAVEQTPNADKNKNDPRKKPPKEEKKKNKFLDTYCRNLTERARRGELDAIVGRQKELSRVIQILCRRQKNNPCLIGEPGVGKTAIAEALAQRIAAGDVPYMLKDKEIYLVDLTALVAGTQFRGQFESRILGLLGEVKAAGNVILVIDEVHNIVGAGDSEGSLSAANMLKPALSRGEVQVIGATTLKEYRKYIEKDSALERRFQPVTVNEPSIADTVEMLKGIKHYYEEYHSIVIPESVLRDTTILSERYITERYLPDKAIDLLDEAAANLSLNSSALNESRRLRDELLKLKEERETLEASQNQTESEQQSSYEKLANIKAKEMRISERIKEIEPECEAVILTKEDIADVIEIWTGIPASSIKENEFEKIVTLDESIKKRIVGQDKAVGAIVRAIKRSRAGVSYKRKPVSFIFAGPTGVGKTELVKVLASKLFDSPETLIRLDMSEFMEKHSVSKIIGAPPGYVGYDEAGQLTEKIRRKPYSVILFDEIEKAHPDVLNVLLQILDDGRVTDAQGRTVNFESTVIVMTTNAGSDRSSAALGFSSEESANAERSTQKALEQFLRPEFLNRVDEVITFNSLSEENFSRIARIMLDELVAALAEKGISLKYTDTAAKLIAERSYSHKFGARNMRRYIQTHVEDKLAELIISNYDVGYTQALINVKDGEIAVNCM